MHGAALVAREGAGEDVVDLVVLDLVLAVQHLAAHRVDQQRVGEGVAGAAVDHVGLQDRAHRAVGLGQRPQADLLGLGEARHREHRPVVGDAADDVAHRGGTQLAADVAGRGQPALQRAQLRRRGVEVGLGAHQRGGDVGDLAAGDAHGDHGAQGGGQVAEALAQQHGVPGVRGAVVGGELLGVDQLEAAHLGGAQAEDRGVGLEPGTGGLLGVGGAGAREGGLREHASSGQDRGGGAEVVPAQADRAQALGDPALGQARQHAAARVEVGEAGHRVAERGDVVGAERRGGGAGAGGEGGELREAGDQGGGHQGQRRRPAAAAAHGVRGHGPTTPGRGAGYARNRFVPGKAGTVMVP